MVVERRVLRSRGWNAVAAVVLLVVAAVCAGVGIAGDVLVGTAIVALVFVVGAVRVWTVGVIVTPDGLVVRELFYTKRLPWAVLRRARVVPRLSRGGTVYNPTIDYVVPARGEEEDEDVRSLTVTALGAHRKRVAQRWVDELDELMRST